ncbi:hypothetical protein [Microbacterium sp. bgisy207]|jgi:hypothetical protein|uniref:hypothetical protein n=1 Tax=Microbacterium sp. bgisy207 TaxID=3413800 RepID=UPI003EBF3E37
MTRRAVLAAIGPRGETVRVEPTEQTVLVRVVRAELSARPAAMVRRAPDPAADPIARRAAATVPRPHGAAKTAGARTVVIVRTGVTVVIVRSGVTVVIVRSGVTVVLVRSGVTVATGPSAGPAAAVPQRVVVLTDRFATRRLVSEPRRFRRTSPLVTCRRQRGMS